MNYPFKENCPRRIGGGYIEVHRVKHGRDSIHPLRSPELRALRQIQKDYADTSYVLSRN